MEDRNMGVADWIKIEELKGVKYNSKKYHDNLFARVKKTNLED